MTAAIPVAEISHFVTQLTLPWPPSVNAYKMPVRAGKFITMALTPRARAYQHEVADAITKQVGRRSLTAYDRPVRIDIELRAPDRRTRDLDNHLKSLFDSLTKAGIWADDSLVDEMTVLRGPVVKDGCALVLIAPLDAQPIPDASNDAGAQQSFIDEP